MATIHTYRYSAEYNRINKTPFMTTVGTLSGALRHETSIINMTLELEYNKVINFNYIYIAELDRYYFVDNVISLANNIWELSLTVDVLMSYKSAIYNLEAFIDRNENEYNEDIIDEKRVIQEGYDVYTLSSPNAVFKNDDLGVYILNGYGITPGPIEE